MKQLMIFIGISFFCQTAAMDAFLPAVHDQSSNSSPVVEWPMVDRHPKKKPSSIKKAPARRVRHQTSKK